MNNYRILIIGPQGSGKSTQAQILSEKMNLPLVSSGDLLRDFTDDQSPEAREARAMMDQGKFIDDNLTARLIKRKVSLLKKGTGFILDGFPRNIEQLDYYNPDFDLVIYLDITDDEAEKRLLKRGREDDTPGVIKERLALFHELTKPLLFYYQNQDRLIKVNGEQPINQVAFDIEQKIAERV